MIHSAHPTAPHPNLDRSPLVHRLPDDILLLIFQDITSSFGTSWGVAIVCRRWREVALACSQLWSWIVVTDEDSMIQNGWAIHRYCERLETQLDRAVSGPLHGSIDVYHLEEEYPGLSPTKLRIRATLLRVISQIHRFTSLYLDGDCCQLDLLPSQPPVFEHLHSLEVQHSSWFKNDFLRHTPVIRKLEMEGVPMITAVHALQWSNLTQIYIFNGMVHATPLLDALRAAADSVDALTLSYLVVNADESNSVEPSPLPESTESVQLERIRTMRLNLVPLSRRALTGDSIPATLRNIRAPRLQELRVSHCADADVLLIRDFLFASSSKGSAIGLTMLSLSHSLAMGGQRDIEGATAIADLLPHIPSLKTFSLRPDSYLDHTDEPNIIDVEPIVATLNKRSTPVGDPDDQPPASADPPDSRLKTRFGGVTMCPLLEEIEFSKVKVSLGSITELLQNRSPGFDDYGALRSSQADRNGMARFNSTDSSSSPRRLRIVGLEKSDVTEGYDHSWLSRLTEEKLITCDISSG